MKKILTTALVGLMASTASAADWQATLDAAEGQTVYWNAWGGDPRTNAFIEWVSDRTEEKYGVTIEQVKLSDTAEAVNRVVSEKAAGKTDDGSVDMIWINGANFASMKENELLFGPFAEDLPNAQFVDYSDGAAAAIDFTIPVEGLEAPWRLAKFVMNYDSARVAQPPLTMTALSDWAGENPGRFTHPHPSDFMGTTFLKQALFEFVDDRDALLAEPTADSFAALTADFWNWYDALLPNLWRSGENFPENQFSLQNLLNDGEVDFAMSFDPASTAGAIEEGLLPETVRVFVPEIGAIGNISFVAIPFNAANREGAMVIANELIDPEVQAHMQNIEVLGSYSVLDVSTLDDDAAAAFAALPSHPALPSNADLGATLPEPHPAWATMLVDEWTKRYTK